MLGQRPRRSIYKELEVESSLWCCEREAENMEVINERSEPERTLALQPAEMMEIKPSPWFSGMFNCMSSVLSFLGKEDWLDESEG